DLLETDTIASRSERSWRLKTTMTRPNVLALIITACSCLGYTASVSGADDGSSPTDLLQGAYRFQREGWIYVHLEGSPERVGFQHGSLLADEIADFLRVIQPYLERSSKRDWKFYREASERMLWPRIDPEYQREIDGIVAGLKAKGVKADRWDLVALNAN